jgi:predicted Zn-dependent peptidase
MARAQHIAEFALYDGNPELVNSELEELLAITGDQIRDAVAKYLNTENRTLLDVVTTQKQ